MWTKHNRRIVTAKENPSLRPFAMAKERESRIFGGKKILRFYSRSPSYKGLSLFGKFRNFIYSKRGDVKIPYKIKGQEAVLGANETVSHNRKYGPQAMTYFLLNLNKQGIKKVVANLETSNIPFLAQFGFRPAENSLALVELDISKMNHLQLSGLKNRPVEPEILDSLYKMNAARVSKTIYAPAH